jgi:16S rRNA (guanine527-N7)-methyltransferase
MSREEIVKILKKNYYFSTDKITQIEHFVNLLLNFNKKYNLISKSTEQDIWKRHVLDSAQIIKLINFKKPGELSDLGSGSGFPGVVLSIYNDNPSFHVKLFEKSPVKRSFLKKLMSENNKFELFGNIYEYNDLSSNYVVCRAFKKLSPIFKISREIFNNPHKLIVLKGKNAEKELKTVSNIKNYRYKMVSSVTDIDSKIIVAEKK